MFLALVLGVVSCQDNLEGLDVNVNGEKGYINVSLAEETRADSAFGFDLSSLTTDTEHELRYILEIYPENTEKVYRDVRYSDNTSVSFPVSIVAGQKYTFAVWADIVAEDANRAADANADLYYDTSKGLKSISIIDANWNAMDEKRDAFTGHATLETGNLSDLNDMTLVRPFAKLRVITNDIESATEPKSAKVTYTQSVYTQFDATTGTASNAKNKAHTYKTFPYTDKEGEMTLFADYLLVTETFATKFDIDVFSDENCTTSIKQNSFDTEISLVRNKVTTIKGSILTDGNITNTPKPANNEIWYTNGSTTEATTSYETDVFGANIVSNTYDAEKECWVIKFDGDVTEIGEDAFFNCDSITSVTIPDSVTTIGIGAFCYCDNLTSVTIPDSVKTIGEVAFAECNSLTSVTIPNSVTTIGKDAFGGCDSLEKFSGKFASEDGRCLIIDGALNSFAPAGVTEYTIPDSVTKINDYVFSEYSNLTKVAIGVNVTTIGKYAFAECSNLTEVIIPNSVKSIGEYAFSECDSLTNVNIPDSVTTIEDSAFRSSQNIKSVTIGNGLQTIESSVFCGCSNLTSVTIGDGVTSIGAQAFCECTSLTSITIPDSVKSIGWSAFAECSSLANVTIPNSVTEIGDWAFYLCSSLTNINIPDSVTTIGEGAFADCSSLAGVTIGNGVTNIESWAFDYCSSLTSVYCKATTTPNAILDFDGYWNAFDYNASGRKIYVPAESVAAYKSADYWKDYAADIVGYDFENGVVVTPKPANNEIWYTTSNGQIVELYSGEYIFGANVVSNTYVDGKGVIKLDGNATKLQEAFESDEYLLTVTLPDSVTELNDAAFSGCPNLHTINFGNGIETVVTSGVSRPIINCPALSKFEGSIASEDGRCVICNGELFYVVGLEGLTSYTLPEGITSMNAVLSSTTLTQLTLPNSLTSIYLNTSSIPALSSFAGACASDDGSCVIINGELLYFAPMALSSTTSYTVDSRVAKIASAFPTSSTLKTVTFPSGCTEVTTRLFDSCANIESVQGSIASTDGKCIVVNNALIELVDKKLTSYTIPAGITEIGAYAFEMGAITSITVPASVTKIGNNAFSNSNTSSIYFKSTTPAEITSLYNQWVIDDDIVLYVPAESVAAYKASWSEYASIIVGYDFENGVVVTPKPANNEIWYTATAMVEPNSKDVFGANIKSNVWDETTGKGIITFDGEVSIIGNRAFNSVLIDSPGRNLTSITLPSSVTIIDDYAFYGCSGLTTIEMENVKTIGQYSFSWAGLVDIVIPDTVTSIGFASFLQCYNLKSVTISKNISNIGRNAFEKCTSLKDCYCKSTTPPSSGRYVFIYNATGRKIYVPAESVAAYKSADGWKDHAADIVGYDFEKGEIVE